MDIYIPLHRSCQLLAAGDDAIQVMVKPPSNNNNAEVYLFLANADNDKYECSISNESISVRGHEALYDAERVEREDSPASDMAIYIARGKEIARSVHFGGAVEYLAAWLNEDRKQGNICHDIHAVASLEIFQKLPQWIKYDLFSMLESEAMKQIFATRYLVEEKREGYKIPATLRNDIKKSAEGKTDAIFSDLMAELMQKPMQYQGSAKKFDAAVQARIQLFRDILT